MPPDSDTTNLDAALAALRSPTGESREHSGNQTPSLSEMAEPADAPDPESIDAADATTDESPPPASLKDLADKSGLDVAALYAMELPGLDMTLGAYKDRVAELREVDATRQAVETERTEQRQERLRWAKELAVAQAAGLHEYSDHEKASIGRLMQRHADAEAKIIMESVPEWGQPATLKADFEAIVKLKAKRGFTALDIAKLMESDARIALDYKDQLDQSRRVEAAMAKVKGSPPKKLLAPARNPAKDDPLQRIYNDPKSSKIDRGLAALIQGAQRK